MSNAASVVIGLGFVSMTISWRTGEFLQMFRSQRFGNDVLAAEPFTQINQFTTP